MADHYNDVIGDAISVAVRRAVDDVGRAPFGEISKAKPRSWGEALAAVTAEPEEEEDVPPERLRPPPDVEDPYEVLGVPRGASWERISAAHRRLARRWHPDGAPEAERSQREELIRRLNVAYAELRVRRRR
jgi:DnaJ domain